MLPFAAVLGIVALGQTLVIMQAGIDLSVAGAVSVVVVITTHNAQGQDDRLLGAVLFALGVVLAAGIANGVLVAVLGLNPIVATLGTNTLLTAVVFAVSDGIPRSTTDLMAEIADGRTLGIPNAVYFAVGATIVTTTLIKLTVGGRRFEAIGANPLAMWTTGLRTGPRHAGAYVWAQLHYWLGGVLLAGIVTQPTAFQGRAYLLPSVAAVVLGGTSLAGGRGNLVATVIAALFLTQLQQFVLALGIGFAYRTLIEAGALAVGIALYTVNWSALLAGRRQSAAGPTALPTSVT
jgi:ribose transport system permease protein